MKIEALLLFACEIMVTYCFFYMSLHYKVFHHFATAHKLSRNDYLAVLPIPIVVVLTILHWIICLLVFNKKSGQVGCDNRPIYTFSSLLCFVDIVICGLYSSNV